MMKITFAAGLERWVVLALAALACLKAGDARAGEATETVRWDRAPIKVMLGVDAERMIRFPGAVQAGIPPAAARKVRVQSVDDTLYLRAAEPFDEQRFQIRELATGRIFLLDVKAAPGGPAHELRIVVAGGQDEASAVGAREPQHADGDSPTYGYVALTRFAARQVYAPRRLAATLPGVVRVPLGAPPADNPLLEGAPVLARPLASWRANNPEATLYVTAVKLTNTSRAPQIIDPRGLRGRWLAATLQHGALAAAGEAADTTTVYLLSERPYPEAAAQWPR